MGLFARAIRSLQPSLSSRNSAGEGRLDRKSGEGGEKVSGKDEDEGVFIVIQRSGSFFFLLPGILVLLFPIHEQRAHPDSTDKEEEEGRV